MKPQRIKIVGKEKSLDEVIEGIVTLREAIELNIYSYRKAWKTWLPSNPDEGDGKGRMAYIPTVCKRKSHPSYKEFSGKVRDIPYFIFILNQARESRPRSSEQTEKKSHCKLCKNLLEKGMIISEIGDFYLTPNGYPYHDYASLLINKKEKVQDDVRVEDIADWIKASILLDQYVFYNSFGAGASINEHQHAQVVDPCEMRIDNEIVPFPILNPSFVNMEEVNRREDVFRLKDYAVDALVFKGRDAPYKASYAVHLLKSDGKAFNILVNKDEIYVIGRNKEKEVSICIKRKVGGYEISGVALLGDIEESFGKIDGATIFTNMRHDVFAKNITAASSSLDGVRKYF